MTYHVYHDFIIKRIMNAVQIIQNYAIICQNANFRDDTKNPLKSRKNPANSGKIWQRKVRKKYDKSIVYLPRQYLPFSSCPPVLPGFCEEAGACG